ncbi:MAG: SidA/IucD/PvdA family monooxygenase, partial [Pseudomonadota bacterium]
MKRTFDFKIACIGAGPSNLSVAAALEDQAPWLAAQTIILERDEKIAWQPGQLIEGTLSQVHHCKDLATLRDPTSRFTFLNYLKTEGRLDDFINMGRNTPYRFEVSDYHAWAAYQLRHVDLRLGNGVRRVVPIRSKQGICGWEIETETGERITSRHLICSVGRALNVPEPLRRLGSDRVVHCANYLPAIESWSHPDPQKIAIIGASQSSAEVAIDCGARFPDAKRVLIMRSIGMASYESSKHTNELFFPGYVDKFNGLEAKDRRSVINQMHRA